MENKATRFENPGRNGTILVTGASGYIASQLIPRLLEDGRCVRGLVRNPAHLQNRAWFLEVEVFSGDLLKPESYRPALEGVSTAYYLVHGMASGKDYADRDLQAALDFGKAAREAGVGHIIYLGGLADPQARIARHMLSRIRTGEALRSGGVPVSEFRAGVIVGPGSISFEMIRFLTEQFPIIPCPGWMSNLSQPIAIENVLDYLLAALDLEEPLSKIFEIGGSQVMSYAETMLTYARLSGLKRRVVLLPFNPVGLLAYFMAKLTPVPGSITRPLVEGLRSDSLVQEDSARQAFPHIQPRDYERAVRDSLGKLDPRLVEPVWRQAASPFASLKHAGFCILQRRVEVRTEAWVVFEAIQNRFSRGADYEVSNTKEWVTESAREKTMLLRSKRKLPGQLWQEWRVKTDREETQVSQTILFAPHGLPGFLAWYALVPWVRFTQWAVFRRFARQLDDG
jgi:uncharacterized protein YbjT (DUF2867 family)